MHLKVQKAHLSRVWENRICRIIYPFCGNKNKNKNKKGNRRTLNLHRQRSRAKIQYIFRISHFKKRK